MWGNRKIPYARLLSWKVVSVGGTFEAPDWRKIKLRGIVENHPTRKDGTILTTATPVSIRKLMFTSKSGVRYRLCSVHPEYLEWVKTNYPEKWDQYNPLGHLMQGEENG